MTEEDIKRIQETIISTVNGKIDRLHDKMDSHNVKHEADMAVVREHIEKVEPIIQEYQEKELVKKIAKNTGDKLNYAAGIVVSIMALVTFSIAVIKGFIPFK